MTIKTCLLPSQADTPIPSLSLVTSWDEQFLQNVWQEGVRDRRWSERDVRPELGVPAGQGGPAGPGGGLLREAGGLGRAVELLLEDGHRPVRGDRPWQHVQV